PLRRIRIPRETSLYGREGELARLRSLYQRASAGEGQVALIQGEAGIGKTRLADELIGLLQSDGEDLDFLFGGYPPGGAATAAGAWSTAYREHFGSDDLVQTLSEYLTVTPSLIPAAAALLLGEPPPAGSEPLTKDSIQTVFVHATRALAAERPTVVLIEDLHFAPEEGRALLAALALAVPEHRILLIATARPGLSKEWISNLERLEQVQPMTLDRLGPKDVGELLIDAFRSERLATELALPIATKSDGNPFFIFEIIRGLREDERIAQRDDGSWVSTRAIRRIEIPSSVRELVQARMAELDEEQRELLDVAACCGFDFDPLLVGDVLGLPDIPLLRRLGRLENPHRIVRSAGMRYVFDHHQVQEALYEAQSGLLRQRYHAAIGEALERRAGEATDGATAVQLCEHFLKGGRGERALRYLDGALEHLASCYRNDEAVGLARRALEIEGLLGGTRRAEVLLSLAERVHRLRRPEEEEPAVKEALALAEEDGDPGLRAPASLDSKPPPSRSSGAATSRRRAVTGEPRCGPWETWGTSASTSGAPRRGRSCSGAFSTSPARPGTA
ncbi:MAG: ATP-binding protein, partial [Planctomycetota bacterium]